MKSNVPGARSSSGNLRLELNGQAQEAIEPIESHVRHVPYIGGPPDLHAAELPPIALASDQRSPENGHQERQQRNLLTFPSVVFFFFVSVFVDDAPSQFFQILMLFDWGAKVNILGESGNWVTSAMMVGGDKESGIGAGGGWGRRGRRRGAWCWRWRKVKDFCHGGGFTDSRNREREKGINFLGSNHAKLKRKAFKVTERERERWGGWRDWIWWETLTVQSMFIGTLIICLIY